MCDKKVNNDELIFKQSSSVQERNKIKELWKFLDTQCNLVPYRPSQSTSKPSLQPCTRTRPCKLSKKCMRSVSEETIDLKSPPSSQDEIADKEMIWYHGLRFFQKIGLDKAILCKDKCKLCQAEKRFRDINYAATTSETYEEMKAEMASFDERLANGEVETSNSSEN